MCQWLSLLPLPSSIMIKAVPRGRPTVRVKGSTHLHSCGFNITFYSSPHCGRRAANERACPFPQEGRFRMSDQTRTSDNAPLSLPENPNLDWLRKQARRCLNELRKTNPDARLAEAQFELAK